MEPEPRATGMSEVEAMAEKRLWNESIRRRIGACSNEEADEQHRQMMGAAFMAGQRSGLEREASIAALLLGRVVICRPRFVNRRHRRSAASGRIRKAQSVIGRHFQRRDRLSGEQRAEISLRAAGRLRQTTGN